MLWQVSVNFHYRQTIDKENKVANAKSLFSLPLHLIEPLYFLFLAEKEENNKQALLLFIQRRRTAMKGVVWVCGFGFSLHGYSRPHRSVFRKKNFQNSMYDCSRITPKSHMLQHSDCYWAVSSKKNPIGVT